MATPVPLVLGALSLLLSLVLAVMTALTIAGSVPLAATSTWPMSVGGYVLTPVTAIIALAWDRVLQRRGLGADKDFVLKPVYGRALRVIVAVSFLPGIWHIANIANVLVGGA